MPASLVTEPREDHWLDSDRLAPATARRRTSDFLSAYGLDALQGDAITVVSELVTNAVQYGSPRLGRVLLTLRAPNREQLHVEIRDFGPTPIPEPRDAALDDEAGRGLQIVSTLARNWGVDYRGDHGKVVWAILADQPTE
ncbi:ATP-binding protein [Kitasatospora acidiphila]